MKKSLQRFLTAVLALLFAGTLSAAETSFDPESGTLSITFTVSAEVVIENDGTNITVTSDNGGDVVSSTFNTNQVNRIVVTGNDDIEDRFLTFETGIGITLSGGLSVSGVETVIFNLAITCTGSSGIEVTALQNIEVNANLTAEDGDIILIGLGTYAYHSNGVSVKIANITTTGLGNIMINGKGGEGYDVFGIIILGGTVSATGNIEMTGQGGEGDSALGILMGGNSTVSATGNIEMTGNGGTGISIEGILILQRTISGDGDIVMEGHAGIGGGTAPTGVAVYEGNLNAVRGKNGSYRKAGGIVLFDTRVEVTGTASITMTGTGGEGGYYGNSGVVIESSVVTAEDGNIVIHGTGRDSEDAEAAGVFSFESAIETTGAGAILLSGTGGTAPFAVGVHNEGKIFSNHGNILITSMSGSGEYAIGLVTIGEIGSLNGNISITGTGGLGDGSFGVWGMGKISSDNGNITIEGEGGTGSFTSGIFIMRGTVSGGGDIAMEGHAGTGIEGGYKTGMPVNGETLIAGLGKTGMAGLNKNGQGLEVGGIVLLNADVVAIGTASINLTGTGGEGSFYSTSGVVIESSAVTAEDGNIVIHGTGGDPNPDAIVNDDSGVKNYISNIQTTASGNIEITGIAGSGSGENYGISMGNESSGGNKPGGEAESLVKATGSGNITLTGTHGKNAANTSGVELGSLGDILIEQSGTGQLEIIGDQILIDESNATITAANNTVTLRPLSNGWPIDLGADHTKSQQVLTLTNGKLDRITAGKLILGGSDAGTISIIQTITLISTDTELHSGGDIIFVNGGFDTGGGALLLSPGKPDNAVKPAFSGTDVTASTLSFASNLAIVINGTTPGDGTGATHTQLIVDGNIDLTGVELNLSGNHDPAPDETFIIVKSLHPGTITGTFNGLPEGGQIDDFLKPGKAAFITYTSDEVVIRACTNPTSGGTITATQTICYGTSPDIIQNEELPTGHTGDLEFNWQSSTTDASSGFADITDSNAEYYQPGTVTQTTWFRRLARVACQTEWLESNVVEVTVDPLPEASAGSSATICMDDSHQVTGASAEHGTINWTHNGAGSLDNETSLAPTYNAAADDTGKTVTLTMTVTSNNTCVETTATAYYTIYVGSFGPATRVNIRATSAPNGQVKFTATPVNGGDNPTYKWFKEDANGVVHELKDGDENFLITTCKSGDIHWVVMQSSLPCTAPAKSNEMCTY
jgi:hypothetical protein